MRYLIKGNRLPFSYNYADLDARFDDLVEESPQVVVPQLGIGNKTVARLEWEIDDVDDEFIIVRLHNTDIMNLWPNGSIMVDTGEWNTKITRNRINAALRGIGKLLVVVNRKLKIYTIATGEYADYHDGMLVKP